MTHVLNYTTLKIIKQVELKIPAIKNHNNTRRSFKISPIYKGRNFCKKKKTKRTKWETGFALTVVQQSSNQYQ